MFAGRSYFAVLETTQKCLLDFLLREIDSAGEDVRRCVSEWMRQPLTSSIKAKIQDEHVWGLVTGVDSPVCVLCKVPLQSSAPGDRDCSSLHLLPALQPAPVETCVVLAVFSSLPRALGGMSSFTVKTCWAWERNLDNHYCHGHFQGIIFGALNIFFIFMVVLKSCLKFAFASKCNRTESGYSL